MPRPRLHFNELGPRTRPHAAADLLERPEDYRYCVTPIPVTFGGTELEQTTVFWLHSERQRLFFCQLDDVPLRSDQRQITPHVQRRQEQQNRGEDGSGVFLHLAFDSFTCDSSCIDTFMTLRFSLWEAVLLEPFLRCQVVDRVTFP